MFFLTAKIPNPTPADLKMIRRHHLPFRLGTKDAFVRLPESTTSPARYVLPDELHDSPLFLRCYEAGQRLFVGAIGQIICGLTGGPLLPCMVAYIPWDEKKSRKQYLWEAAFDVGVPILVIRADQRRQCIVRECSIARDNKAAWIHSRIVSEGLAHHVPPHLRPAAECAVEKAKCPSCASVHYTRARRPSEPGHREFALHREPFGDE